MSHSWFAVAAKIISGEWCNKCKRAPRTITIELLVTCAKELCSARLLDNSYNGVRSRYSLQCMQVPEHTWSVCGSSIVSGKTGCRKCAGIKRRVPIEEASRQISEAGFQLVSPLLTKGTKYYTVRCQKSHEWPTTLGHIREGKGCPYCSKKVRHTIADAQHEGEKPNITCLSTSIKNSRSRLEWQCRTCQFKWISSLTCVMNTKHGCPNCAREAAALTLRLPLEHLQKVAVERGGKLLTLSYTRGQEHLE